MKVVEPVSSALLITACVYSAGVSQNNAFLRSFKLSPEFSQPSLDKIFYDGGIILYEILYKILYSIASFITVHPVSVLATLLVLGLALKKASTTPFILTTTNIITFLSGWSSIAFIAALMGLSFLAYEKGQIDGAKIAKIYLNKCYEIRVTSGDNTSTGCAFRKDKDSIWYYTAGDKFKVFSETLTETSKIEYLSPRPVISTDEAVNGLYRPMMK